MAKRATMTPDQVQAVAAHVNNRLRQQNLRVADAIRRSGVSERLWYKITGAKGPVTEWSLQMIAAALEEPPQRLLELAGYVPVVTEEGEDRSVGERLDQLEATMADLADQVRSVTQFVWELTAANQASNSSEHPDTSPGDAPTPA